MAEYQGPEARQMGALNELTQAAVLRQEGCEVAAFLTQEDEASIYLADPQGTWVIARDAVMFMEDWAHASSAPESMQSSGRPVRVGIREGATIQEIRPWRMHKEKRALGSQVGEAIDKIFTLGGASLPVGEHTTLGEAKLREIERMFVRRIGWHPDPNDPAADYSALRAGSWTMVHFDGY
jgi:hypothetical protein